jgi:hypothetical protein
MNWSRMARIERRWIPTASIQHPWPEQRFDVRTQGRSPVRSFRSLGSVRGAARASLAEWPHG